MYFRSGFAFEFGFSLLEVTLKVPNLTTFAHKSDFQSKINSALLALHNLLSKKIGPKTLNFHDIALFGRVSDD
jgi:hypothetical protein